MSSQLEPYDCREVANWLIERGARLLPTVGGGLRTIEVAPGRTIKLGNGSLPTLVAKRVASALGMSYADLRLALGHPIVKTGKPKSKVAAVGHRACSKSDVAARIKGMRRTLAEIEKATSVGVRDAAFYGRVHERLADASRQAEFALNEATRTGAR